MRNVASPLSRQPSVGRSFAGLRAPSLDVNTPPPRQVGSRVSWLQTGASEEKRRNARKLLTNRISSMAHSAIIHLSYAYRQTLEWGAHATLTSLPSSVAVIQRESPVAGPVDADREPPHLTIENLIVPARFQNCFPHRFPVQPQSLHHAQRLLLASVTRLHPARMASHTSRPRPAGRRKGAEVRGKGAGP
jgi:hypothetical protein